MAEADKDKKKKVQGFKEVDPTQYVDVEPTISEAKVGEVVIAWGRMNPITVGHEKLIKKVSQVAKSKGATPSIFLTHSQDNKKNPLAYDDKVKYAEQAFGQIIKRSNAKTIIQLLAQLQRKFSKVTLVVGSDRYKEMDLLLNKYNGKEYSFDELDVVSAGARDPDAEGVKGMSASKMREYATSDNIKKFTSGLPSKLKSSAADIMASIKKGMGMSEEYNEDDLFDLIEEDDLDEALTRQQRIKRGRTMRRMRVKMKRGREKAKRRRANIDVLKKRARKAARTKIKTRLAGNKRYADMEPAEKERIDKRIEKISKQRIDNLAIKLLPTVKKKERERMQARHGKKNESVDLNEMWGKYITKRPHMLMDKNNKPKFDKRFKMFKPKQVAEMNEFDIEDIVGLMESVEDFNETTGKYYTGVAKDKKDDREDHFDRNAKKADDDPSAYKPAPGDKEAKTKESKHTKKARAMGYTEEFDFLGEDAAGKSLKDKAMKSGMPAGILRKVYNRGVAAWKTGHRPGTTPEQWGHARVNSFITKSPGTWGKADKDLAGKVRKEEVELDEARFSPRDVKMAIGIASDKRYKGGNMTGAVKAMDKMKPGISKHPQVAAVLKRQNEDMNEAGLDEISMNTLSRYKDKAKYSRDRAQNSAAANYMRGTKGSGGKNDPDIKTMQKRDRGKELYYGNIANKLRKQLGNLKKEATIPDGQTVITNESVEQLEELTAAEKKLVNQMYDKKGNLTAIGKKVMDHGKKAAGMKEAFGRARFAQQLKRKGIDVNKLHNQNVKDAAAAKERRKAAQTDYDNFKNKKESLDDKFEAFLSEDAKMKKQSDDNLKSLHKQFKGMDQKMPSTQHMMKRITKEMKRRNMSESDEAEKLASVANSGIQDKEDKFKIALKRVRDKKSMKDESSCGSSKKRNEEAGAGEEGTAKLVKRLKKDTPNA